MKAILWRDFRAYRTFWMLQFVLTLLYTFLNLRFGSIDGIVSFLVVFLPPIAVLVLFLGDVELMSHMAAMPVTRKEMVVGKYVSTYLFCISMIGLTISIMGILGFWYGLAKADFLTLLTPRGFIFAILPMTLIISIAYPFLFRYGFQIGTMLIAASVMLCYSIMTVAGESWLKNTLQVSRRGSFVLMMEVFRLGEQRIGAVGLYGGLSVAVIVMLYASVKLSIRWVQEKDFK